MIVVIGATRMDAQQNPSVHLKNFVVKTAPVFLVIGDAMVNVIAIVVKMNAIVQHLSQKQNQNVIRKNFNAQMVIAFWYDIYDIS